jgi:hypothetical protein
MAVSPCVMATVPRSLSLKKDTRQRTFTYSPDLRTRTAAWARASLVPVAARSLASRSVTAPSHRTVNRTRVPEAPEQLKVRVAATDRESQQLIRFQGPETGPITVAVSSSETVGYTTSVSVGVAFEVFSAGVDFSTEQSFTETISRDFEVPAGQQGYIVWTPIYRCVDGHLSDCDDDDGEVRFCTAATTDAGNLSGSWAFQQRI